MHEGGWEPFVHHFSSMLGGVVPKDEETRAGGISCTKSAPATPAPRPAPHHARRPAPRLLIRKFINFRMIIKVY